MRPRRARRGSRYTARYEKLAPPGRTLSIQRPTSLSDARLRALAKVRILPSLTMAPRSAQPSAAP